MNRAGKVALGCLLFPVLLLVIMLVFVLSARMAGVPEPELVSANLEQGFEIARIAPRDSEAQTQLELRPGQSQEIPPFKGEFVRVRLHIEEAEMEIVPGPAAKGIQVTADYDESTYDLIQEYGMDDDGHPTYSLSLKPRIHWMRRLLASGSGDFEDEDNYIRVRLPVDTPMELTLKLSKGEGEIDLTDIALVNLRGDLEMGAFSLEIDNQNPIDMGSLVLNCRMGEYQLHGLARLAPSEMRIEGGMGEMLVDLGGPLLRDTKLSVKMQMGELRLRLPDNAFWDGGATAWLGEVIRDSENQGNPDPEGLKLQYRARVSFGELDIGSYSAGGTLRSRRD